MASPLFDKIRLERSSYDCADPLSMARFMRTSCEFMDLVRQDVFPLEATPLLDQFCQFINSEHVWNLAQMVVPEFRSAAILPEEDRSCLDYILRKLSVSPLFPLPRPTRNVLTTEFDLLKERHRNNVEYLVTGGQGRSLGTEEQLRDADELRKPVEEAFQASLHPEHSRLNRGGKAAVAEVKDEAIDEAADEAMDESSYEPKDESSDEAMTSTDSIS